MRTRLTMPERGQATAWAIFWQRGSRRQSVRDGFPLRNTLKWRCPSWTRAAQIRQKPAPDLERVFHRNGCFSAHNTQITPTGQVRILKPQSFDSKTKRKTTSSSFLRNFLTWFLCVFRTLWITGLCSSFNYVIPKNVQITLAHPLLISTRQRR